METLLDLAVDGADEVDPELNLIKGLGRALLREKIVEIHTDRLIIIVDDSKLVSRLGTKGPLPVEIVSFEADAHIEWLNTLGCWAELWLEQDGSVVRSDNGNQLALCTFPDGISDPREIGVRMKSHPGIIEHGLFLDMAKTVIVAGANGIRCLER
jgi:ribose 5-phosphate isomerase A